VEATGGPPRANPLGKDGDHIATYDEYETPEPVTPRLLSHMPHLRALGERGFRARLDPVLPAVTCTVQSTLLTGETPAVHGAVANGWYFRDLGEVLLWRRRNRLVGGEKIWETVRRPAPGYTVANVCWWYAMGADVNWTDPAPRLPRRRPQGARLLHPPASPARRTHRSARGVPALPVLGPTADIASSRPCSPGAR
jgi:hypothetical protein